jgi:hypothetical protein
MLVLDDAGVTGYIPSQNGNVVYRSTIASRSTSAFAGSGTAGSLDGVGLAAEFSSPQSIVWLPTTLYVVDQNSHRIRKIDIASVRVTTFAGSSNWYVDGVGTEAQFTSPRGITIDMARSTLYVSEWKGHRIRSIHIASKQVSTIAGSGTQGFANGFGANARIAEPLYLSTSPRGVIYFPDFAGPRIRSLTCLPCPAGSYCSSGAPVTCPIGSYCPLHSENATPCPTGRFGPSSGSASITACLPCAMGTFGAAPGSSTCVSCAAGTFSPAVGATSGATCGACGAGTFSSAGAAVCCVVGSWSSPGTTSCTACPVGTYSSAQGATNASTCSICPCPAACTAPGMSDAPSCSATPSGSSSRTGSGTISPSRTATPSSSPSYSSTGTQTPTTTRTRPPFSCFTRQEGCVTPALLPVGPQAPSGLPLGAAPLLTAAWPFVAAAVALALPVPPSPGESVLVRCAALPAGSAVVVLAAGAPFAACTPAAAGEACLSIPSSAAGAVPPPANATILLAPLPVPAPPPAALACTLFSTLREPRDYANLPRYSNDTTLTVTLAPPPSPSATFLLASVLAESRAIQGAFRVLGGAGAAIDAALPLLAAPDLGAPSLNATFLWSDPAVGANASALAPLLALMRAISDGGGAPSLVGTLSGPTHLLLSLSNASAPFLLGVSNVTVNSVPCALNWVSPDGRLASVTTPSLFSLCPPSAVSARADCGSAVLLLFSGADPASTLTSALSAGAAPLLPAAYPPLLPPFPAIAALPEWGALVGLDAAALPPVAVALSPDGAGLRIAAACTDRSYADPEFCGPVGTAPPPPPPNGTACAWGSGDSCVLCPTDRALCPGGLELLPLPGWWAPLRTSPPSDLLPCPAPDATVRCPGWTALSTGGCGASFRGQACAGCAPGFFFSAGSCAPCPMHSASLAQVAPILTFAGALGGVGILLLGAAQVALSRGSRAPPACCSPEGAPRAVLSLLAWTWTSVQSAAALFSQTLSAGLVPLQLLPAFSVLAALQFVGVTLAPECYASFTPFWGLWVSLALTCGALVAMLCAVHALPAARDGTIASRFLHVLLKGSALVLTVGFGAYVNAAVTVLSCRPSSPMAVGEYVRASSDGRALTAALGGAAPPLAALRAAQRDPFLAQRAGLSALLRTAIPVSTLASDPFTVCREGAHAIAWPVAAAFLTLLVAVVPGLGVWALWGAGRLKGLRRMLSSAAIRKPDAAARRRPTAFIADALLDGSFRPRFAWLTFFQWALTALCSAGVALTQRTTSPATFLGLQAVLIVALLGAAGFVMWARPYLPRERWRAPVQMGLYLLAAASAGVNVVMRFAGEAAARGPLGWTLASAIVLFAVAIFCLLFGGWWAALVTRTREICGAGTHQVPPMSPPSPPFPPSPSCPPPEELAARVTQTLYAKGAKEAILPTQPTAEEDREEWAALVARMRASSSAGTGGLLLPTVGQRAGGLLGFLRGLRFRAAEAGRGAAPALPPSLSPPTVAALSISKTNPLCDALKELEPQQRNRQLKALQEHSSHRDSFHWATRNQLFVARAAALEELRSREALARGALNSAERLGITGLFIDELRAAGERVRKELEAHEVEIIAEAGVGDQCVVVGGVRLFLDGCGGRPLAEGWRRMEDEEGDVWYVSETGESEWEPVYAAE